MRRTVGLIVLASSFAVLLAVLADDNSAHYETHKAPPQTFVLQPGLIQPVAGPLCNGWNVATVHIHALSPVTVGFIHEESLRDSTAASALQAASCHQERVLDATLVCPLARDTPPWVLAIQDDRTAIGAAGSGLAAVFGIRRPAEQYLIRNDVTVRMEAVVCTDNCPDLQ